MDITFDKNATCLCKGIAICLMIYYHLFGATDLSMFQVVLPPVFGILGPYGNVCVMFFVLLTGTFPGRSPIPDRSPHGF